MYTSHLNELFTDESMAQNISVLDYIVNSKLLGTVELYTATLLCSIQNMFYMFVLLMVLAIINVQVKKLLPFASLHLL